MPKYFTLFYFKVNKSEYLNSQQQRTDEHATLNSSCRTLYQQAIVLKMKPVTSQQWSLSQCFSSILDCDDW